jgi:hypothetical protein
MHSFETSKSIEQKVMYSLKMIRKGKNYPKRILPVK